MGFQPYSLSALRKGFCMCLGNFIYSMQIQEIKYLWCKLKYYWNFLFLIIIFLAGLIYTAAFTVPISLLSIFGWGGFKFIDD